MLARFHLQQHRTTVSKEILCGTTSFLTMSYILFVNPLILSSSGMPPSGVFVATALTAGLCSILMGLIANAPFGMAPGMGLNSFFTYVICSQLGFHWREALALVFLAGLFHLLIMATGARKALVNAIPQHLKLAFGVGLGIFIGYTGMKSAGFIIFTTPPGQYQVLPNGTAISSSAAVPSLISALSGPQLLAIIGLTVMLVLLTLEKQTGEPYAALPIGILTATFVGIPMSITNLIGMRFIDLPAIGEVADVLNAFWGNPGLLSLATSPDKLLLAGFCLLVILVVNLMDSIGTIIGTGQVRDAELFSDEDIAAFSRQDGKTRLDKALLCNSFGGSLAALLGTSTATAYMESITGIVAGGRTGLAALTVGGLFLICLPFANFFSVIPAAAIAPALMVAGAFMVPLAARIRWHEFDESIPAFATIMCIPLTYSFAHGIAAGVLSHLVIQAAKGNWRRVHPILYLIAAVFILVLATESLL